MLEALKYGIWSVKCVSTVILLYIVVVLLLIGSIIRIRLKRVATCSIVCDVRNAVSLNHCYDSLETVAKMTIFFVLLLPIAMVYLIVSGDGVCSADEQQKKSDVVSLLKNVLGLVKCDDQ